jgi:hypothetical protein
MYVDLKKLENRLFRYASRDYTDTGLPFRLLFIITVMEVVERISFRFYVKQELDIIKCVYEQLVQTIVHVVKHI